MSHPSAYCRACVLVGAFGSRVRGHLSVLRLTPFDGSTAEGRARERHRRVLLTALASGVAKGVTVLTLVVSVPLTIRYLGVERYGLWLTISSAVAILGFADLGMGNGLLNAIAEAHGKDSRESAREYVSSAAYMLSAVAVLLGLVFAIGYFFVPWQRVFNVKASLAVAESGPATAAFVACFLVNIPLGIVQRVQLGYQEGFANSLWQAGGSLLSLASLLLVIRAEGGLVLLVLALSGAPTLATLVNGGVLFSFQRPWLFPRWRSASARAARRILRLGIMFFVLQIAVAVAYSSDNLIVAQVLGPQAVSEYAVTARMFALAPMVLSMFLAPLWPAYGESIARGDILWTKRTLARSLRITLLFIGLTSLFLVCFGNQILGLWVGPTIAASLSLLLGLGVWTVLNSVGNALAMFLNGSSIIGIQVVTASVMAVAALATKIYLVHKIGLPGLVWGTVIAYTFFVALPMAIYIPRLVGRLGAPHNAPAS